jgi:hypothetical protein
MKRILALLASVYITMSSGIVLAETDDQILLNSVHKYGITKCDKFIIKNSKLIGNWNFFISKHKGAINETVNELSIIQIYGSKNDTVKTDDTYIQSNKGCFVHQRSTTSFSGPCSEHVDMTAWYVSTDMPDKDYTSYKNKGGVEMHVKEISMGNFKACIQEVGVRNSAPLEHQGF